AELLKNLSCRKISTDKQRPPLRSWGGFNSGRSVLCSGILPISGYYQTGRSPKSLPSVPQSCYTRPNWMFEFALCPLPKCSSNLF
ncbi:MAG: hypothetical protein WBA24_21015, partial [Geitlerinemataceae cyanobacterium]